MAMTHQYQQNNPLNDNSQFDSWLQTLGTELHFDHHNTNNNFDHDAHNILQSLDGSHGLSDDGMNDHNNHDDHNSLNNSENHDQQMLSDHSHDSNIASENVDNSNHQLDADDHPLVNTALDDQTLHDSWQNNDHNHLDTSNLSDHSANLTEHSHEDLSASVPGKTNASLHETQQLQSLNYTDSGAITTSDNKSVELYANNNIYWHSGARIGRVDGQNFYDSYGNYIGRLGVDLNVYNAGGYKIGCVTPSGNAYTPGGKLFATGGTARWAAATLIFNTCL